MGIRSWPEIERILRRRGESEDEIFSLKSEYFDRVSTELGEDPESDIIKSKRNLFLYGNEKEWELLKAAKSGLIRGFGEVPETGADIIAFGQRFFPGDSENLNAIEENLRGMAEDVREKAGPFQPSSFQERVVAGVSQAPGIATSMIPVTAAVSAAAVPAAAAVGLGPVAAPIAAGALGFGAYEAIRNARGTPEEMLKGFGKGATLGTVLAGANRLTRGVGKGLGGGLKSEAAGYLAGAGATGVGAGAVELATGAPPEQAAETAAVFGLMSLAHRNKYNKISNALNKAGVTDPKAKDAAYEVSNEIEQQQWAARRTKKKRNLPPPRPGVSGEWVRDVKTSDAKFEVDASIADLVQFLNDNGIKTAQSMSGLKEDYEGTPAADRYSENGYISFYKEDLTDAQIELVKNAAEKSGLAFEESDTFFKPSIVVRTGISKGGISRREVLKNATREYIRRQGISDEEYDRAYAGEETENLRPRRASVAFPSRATDPVPKNFLETYHLRDKLFDQMWRKLGGNIDNSEIRSRWDKFQSYIENPTSQPMVKASEVEAETNVPFEQITGAVPWKLRFRRASGEIKSKADIYLEMWKKIQILNMQKKAAAEEPGAMYIDAKGNVIGPTPEYSRHWDAKFQGTIRPLQEAHRRAPDDRVGAVYEVLDSTGKNPVYRIQRIDWSKKSPAQWMATSLVDPTAKPRTFRTLAEAEALFQKELNADPRMTAGEVFHRGLSFAQSDNRMLRMFGRSLIAIGAKKMGRPDLADAVSPISADDAMRLSAKELGIPLGQALINDRGLFSVRNNDITMANLKDPETFFHELGHFITKVILKHRRGASDENIRINDYTLKDLFTPEELVILEGMGKAEYTPYGSEKPQPIANGNSYEAEGISRYFRGKLYGLDPESYYTKMFTSSPEGKSIAAKLDSWLQGIDPENPNNSGRIPGFGDKMDRVAKIWDRYRQQNPQQITESFSSNTRGGLLTNPVRELGRAIQQAWTSTTKWIEDKQLEATKFLERKPGEGIPDEQNLAYLQQFNHGSSIGQMGRGWSLTGKMVTPTGIIETKTPQEVISEAGFMAVKGKGNQERLLDEYVFAHNWSRTKRDLMLINESASLQNSYKAKIKRLKDVGYVNKDGTVDKSKAGEAGFEVPQDPTGMESKTVPGRKILSAGELLGLEGEGTIQNLREKAHHYETEGRKYLEGKEIYDPFEHLRKLDEQYPNANKALSEFELELESALALVNSPIDAGGTGVPWFEKNGAPIYRTDGTRDPGPADFHGLDLQDMLERVKNNRRNFRSEADRIRSNPELDTNIAKYELDSAQMIGGKSIRPTDYWGTSKVASPIIQWIMRVENSLGSTSFNRYMENVYRLIGVQEKLGLNIGQIPSSSAVLTKIKTGGLSDVEKEMMVGWRFNGRQVYIQFNPNTPEGIRAFNSVKRSNPLFAGNALLDIILGGPKRMMVLGTTGANAGFLVYTNAIRDTMTAAIQSKIPERRGFAGIYRTFHDFVPFLIKANAEILKYGPKEALKRATTPKEKDMLESYLRFIASPVKGAAMIGEDWRSRRSQVSENLMRSKMMSVKNESETQKTLARRQLIAHTIAHPIDMLRTLSTISEDLNRFPEFYMSEKAMINQGKNPIMQPIAAGAEVSIDFKRAGMYSRVINDMVPFFNPTLQGVSKFARTLFNDKEPSLKNLNGKALAFAAQTVTIPSIGLWMIHKDEEWYKELPNWEKLMFWHVKMGNTVFRIPVPFEWGLAMGQLPVMVYDSIYNDAPERVKEQLMIGLRQIVPYGFVDNMPQTIKPAVEAISNKNFFTGIPIESRKMLGLLPQERYTENTLDFYKAVGSATGTSPVMIEHLVRGYFGSVVNGLISDIEATVQLEPKKYTHGMILSRMVSNTDRPGQSVADFYNKLDIADKAWKTAKIRIESGDTGAAAKILNKYKSYLGLDAKSIRDIILTKNTTTPPALLDMHRSYMAIAQARKEKENKAMTEVAQAALGRDWDE